MLDGEDEMNNDFKVAKPEPLTGAKKQPSSQILDRFPAASNTWLSPRPQTIVS